MVLCNSGHITKDQKFSSENGISTNYKGVALMEEHLIAELFNVTCTPSY